LVPAFFRKVGVEGVFNFDETVGNEVLDLTRGQADMFSLGHVFILRSATELAEPVDLIATDALGD
jgi:hypothetical protein